MKHFTYTKETDTDIWTMQTILEPIISSSDVRTTSFIYDLKPPRTIEVMPQISGSAIAKLTAHRGCQPLSHQCQHLSAPSSAPREFNPAPAIFAGLMIGIAAFHGWGMVQYYRGTVDSRVEHGL